MLAGRSSSAGAFTKARSGTVPWAGWRTTNGFPPAACPATPFTLCCAALRPAQVWEATPGFGEEPFLDCLWTAIDEVMVLKECDVYRCAGHALLAQGLWDKAGGGWAQMVVWQVRPGNRRGADGMQESPTCAPAPVSCLSPCRCFPLLPLPPAPLWLSCLATGIEYSVTGN